MRNKYGIYFVDVKEFLDSLEPSENVQTEEFDLLGKYPDLLTTTKAFFAFNLDTNRTIKGNGGSGDFIYLSDISNTFSCVLNQPLISYQIPLKNGPQSSVIYFVVNKLSNTAIIKVQNVIVED